MTPMRATHEACVAQRSVDDAGHGFVSSDAPAARSGTANRSPSEENRLGSVTGRRAR